MNSSGLSAGDRLDSLLETMRAFAEAASDYQHLLDVISERATLHLGEGCSIYLTSDAGDSAEPVALLNLKESRMGVLRGHFGKRSVPLDGKGTVARAIREGQAVRINVEDAPGEEFRPENREALGILELRSVLAVPLQAREHTIGALVISRHGDNRHPFTAEDAVFAQTLANHAALALRNAQLLASVQRELNERKKAETETKKFVALVQRSREFIAMAGFDGRILFVNDAGRELVGLELDRDLADIPLSMFHTEDGMKRAEVLRTVGHWEGEGQLRHFVTGELIPTQITSLVLRSLDGEQLCFATVQRDMREKRRFEERLRQAQKMEAIGRLAGGVAHDFNNLLSVILSCGYMLCQDLEQGSVSHGQAEEIHKAGERAAALTQQLLAFSRQQLLEPMVVDLNQVLRGMGQMMHRLLGEDVELELLLDDQIGSVLVDPSQMEQVVLNLAVNARDAMPSGGKLSMSTSSVELDEARARARDFAPGRYVLLSVSDNGTGMDSATTSRVFEPFFTTKLTGKGTGLGLATVFGIVEQSRGHVLVTSELGRGTIFDLYFPTAQAGTAPSLRPARLARPSDAGGGETVLLVEDDAQVRTLMYNILLQAGYRVVQAEGPLEALDQSERLTTPVDLLVTDVVMPRMSGRELATRLVARSAGTKVLYVSGYAEDALGRHGVLDAGITLLQKPVTPDALRRRVREVLDTPS